MDRRAAVFLLPVPVGFRILLACLFVSTAPWASEPVGGDAQLPREQVVFEITESGRTIQVAAGDDLQAAIDAARPGDTLVLEAGAVFRGPFVLPRKAPPASAPSGNDATRWITLRPGPGSHALPPAGVRVTPADAPAMARLESGRDAVIRAEPGASHYRLIGLEIRPGGGWLRPNRPTFLNGLMWLHSDSRSPDDTPHHFLIERCYFSGDPEVGSRRGLVMNSAHTAVLDSYFADFKMQGADSQAIIGWAGPGPFLIRNNYLEGSGENILCGGADPTIEGLVPSDIEVLGNHFAKPLSWWEADPSFGGTRWSVKNLFELKNARRVLVEGNLFEHNWVESQNGFAILFTVRNQDGGSPWSVVEDVTFRNNVVRDVANVFNILGFDDLHPSEQTKRIVIRNNLFDEVGGVWGQGDMFQVLFGMESLVIEHNTARHTGRILLAEGRPNERLRFTDNVVIHNEYGIIGRDMAPGVASLDRYFTTWTVRDNLIVGGAAGHDYPRGNAFPESFPSLVFASPASEAPAPRNAKAGADLAAICTALSATERRNVCAPAGGQAP